MTDEPENEIEETEPQAEAEEKPARRRRRRAKPAADEVEPTTADVEAEEATEVVLEADDEAEDEPKVEDLRGLKPRSLGEAEADAEAPKPRGRRRGGDEKKAEEKPAKPAPSRRRRSQRDPRARTGRAGAGQIRALVARKARLVCDHIRGKSVEEARAILAHTPRAIARDWSKLLESAVANAEHNHELVGEDLYVKAVKADEGPTIKRFGPRAMGRATRIRKRTSHLTILLTPKE